MRGQTLRELAAATEVTAGALSQIEKGTFRPTAATANRIALALGLPRAFFSLERRQIGRANAGAVHFRSLRSTSARDRHAAWAWSEAVLDVAMALEIYVDFPPVAIPAVPLDAEATTADVCIAVGELRQAWALPAGPVGNLVRLLEVHGVVATRTASGSAKIDAFSNAQGSRPVVVLGTGKADAARSRFDAAHELGHLVCHPEADPGSDNESQANAFAAELLMPEEVIAHELPRRFDLGRYGQLKHRWGVSIQALLHRSRSLGITTDDTYRRALIKLGQTYGRTDEPFPLPAPEQPQLLPKAFRLATHQGLTLEHLGELTGLPHDALRDIVLQPIKPRVELA